MTEPGEQRPVYRWPRYVLVAVIVGALLAVWWVNREVQRTRKLHYPSSTTPAAENK